MWQIIQAIIVYTWLFAVLALLYRHAIYSGNRQRKLQETLVDASNKSSLAALKMAEAMEKLVAYLGERHVP